MNQLKKTKADNSDFEMTLNEVAFEMGLSNQMISHIEKNALKKFIICLNAKNIKYQDFLGE